MAGDIYGHKRLNTERAITADMCTLVWDGAVVTQANNVQVVYSRGVTRRRTLGGNGSPIAVMYPSQPTGRIMIQFLVTEKADALFSKKGWNICEGLADISVDFSGASALEGCDLQGANYVASGCAVTNFTFNAEAENLTVVQNVDIDYLQLWQGNPTGS